MSNQFSRRNLLKTVGVTGTGIATISGIGSADEATTFDQRALHGNSVGVIEDVTVVGESERDVVVVLVKLKETNKRTGEVRYHTYSSKIHKSTGKISQTRVDDSQYKSLQTLSEESPTTQSHWPELPGYSDIVKKKDHYLGQNIGSCEAFDHQHRQDGVTMWFYHDIGKIGVGTVLAAAGAYVGYIAESALLTVGGTVGGGKLSTDILERYVSTHTLSLVAWECDVSQWGWNQTMWATDMSGHWHDNNPNHMFTIHTTVGHPSCGNCGF